MIPNTLDTKYKDTLIIKIRPLIFNFAHYHLSSTVHDAPLNNVLFKLHIFPVGYCIIQRKWCKNKILTFFPFKSSDICLGNGAKNDVTVKWFSIVLASTDLLFDFS